MSLPLLNMSCRMGRILLRGMCLTCMQRHQCRLLGMCLCCQGPCSSAWVSNAPGQSCVQHWDRWHREKADCTCVTGVWLHLSPRAGHRSGWWPVLKQW